MKEDRIPFNRPYMTGKELYYIAEAKFGNMLVGDGPFTTRCHRWLEARTGSSKALLTHSCTTDLESLPSFDIVLAIGLLHHLDDAVAVDVMQLAAKALQPGGRLLTIDPCLDVSQSPIARLLIRSDRGQNVRDKVGYEGLASAVFESPRVEVRHTVWIPYTHCFMECRK